MASDGQGFDKTMIMTPTVKSEPPPAAVLSCVGPPPPGTAQVINLVTSQLTFGRGDNHDVVLKVQGVSRNHARVYPGDGAWGVEDLGSTNGVYVNKSKVDIAWLTPGDIVSIGKVHYKYGLASAKPAALPIIDISDTDKTMVIRPGSQAGAQPTPPLPDPAPRPAAANAPAQLDLRPPQAAQVQPAAGRVGGGDTSVGRKPAMAAGAPVTQPAARASSDSSVGMWLIVALVAAGIVAGAYFLLN